MPKTKIQTTPAKIPAYLQELYSHLYRLKSWRTILEDDRTRTLLTFGCYNTIIEELLEEIGTNSSVLQIGCTFGSQMLKTAKQIGPYGSYVIADILPSEIEYAKKKLAGQNVVFKCVDARMPFEEKYDTVICFMLLHELPERSKQKVINNALDAVGEHGKAIFIDYRKPSKWNFLRFLIKPFNRLYFPFAEKLWFKDIRLYATHESHFAWYQKTYGKKMYQKVIASRKISDHKKPDIRSSFY